MEKDIESANENIAEARSGVAKLQQELGKLKKELSKSEVGWYTISSISLTHTPMTLSGLLQEGRAEAPGGESHPVPVR